MEEQDWEGKDLDKDFLGDGKLYSPETCIFIPPWLNKFLTDASSIRGDCAIGVSKTRGRKRPYQALCCNPLTRKRDWLGYFDTEEEAHMAWRKHKNFLANQIVESDEVTDERLIEALKTRFS